MTREVRILGSRSIRALMCAVRGAGSHTAAGSGATSL